MQLKFETKTLNNDFPKLLIDDESFLKSFIEVLIYTLQLTIFVILTFQYEKRRHF